MGKNHHRQPSNGAVVRRHTRGLVFKAAIHRIGPWGWKHGHLHNSSIISPQFSNTKLILKIEAYSIARRSSPKRKI